MFDVTPEEILQLSDVDLRALVARLCEAELASLGLSAAAVTWGGSQTAADGGVDVRVELPAATPIGGFIPRAATGFQVKKPDMPRRQILKEMAPKGTPRRSIRALAAQAGAYVIVSSTGSTADEPLRDRRAAMRHALTDVHGAEQLHTDFYDRTRLATWTRRHPAVVAWLKERIGRRFQGWSAYGDWSASTESADAQYLIDEHVRLRSARSPDESHGFMQAMAAIRDDLRMPGKAVRLVGLSGVGKTRLVQALFDDRVGVSPLAPSLAIYANLSDHPDPQPIALASDLIASRSRAVLVIDNCPPDLHTRLVEICRKPESTVSLITIEYDVRDDQPEGTDVFVLEASSADLIAALVRRRFPHISLVDIRTIADASGGNARIAIALAETVGLSESIGGLTNEDLFNRLFRQRQSEDSRLLRIAQACSLVYSFHGEAVSGGRAEIPRLAALAGQTTDEVYAYVAELQRRGLLQHRGPWRAVLPHAIANRLAARALDDIPFASIEAQLIAGGSDRLARSFSRRLSYLHNHPRAHAIAKDWLAVGGFLGDVARFNDLGRVMFQNVAPVLPMAALAALERAAGVDAETANAVVSHHVGLLLSLAYDADTFHRCSNLLGFLAAGDNGYHAKQARDAFVSLFGLYLSGTHATIEQRLALLEGLVVSADERRRELGMAALERALKTNDFNAVGHFQFGARSRDFGFHPGSAEEVLAWYAAGLEFVERLYGERPEVRIQMQALIARNLRGLWFRTGLHDPLERLARTFSGQAFWREGWAACRKAVRLGRGKYPQAALERLEELERQLCPRGLADEVRAYVMGTPWNSSDMDLLDAEGGGPENFQSAMEQLTAKARVLGLAVGRDEQAHRQLLGELLRGGTRVRWFGEGLVESSTDVRATWALLESELASVPPSERRVDLLEGFIAGLQRISTEGPQELLDAAMRNAALRPMIPDLHAGLALDAQGVRRMLAVLESGEAEPWRFRHAVGHQPADGALVRELAAGLSRRPGGFEVALGIVHFQIHRERSQQRELDSSLLSAGEDLLRLAVLYSENMTEHTSYELGQLVQECLYAEAGSQIATELAGHLRDAALAHRLRGDGREAILEALLRVQPNATLEALFGGDEQLLQPVIALFHVFTERNSAADVLLPETLLRWCRDDADRRFAIASTFVTFAESEAESGAVVWSDQALVLLQEAPDPCVVLANFVDRFRPMSWTGSRAALLERNASLLGKLPDGSSPELLALAAEHRSRLSDEVARELQSEAREESARNERFE